MTAHLTFFNYSFVSVFLFFSINTFSQTPGVAGKITTTGNDPLTGVIAELRNVKDSSLAKVNVTDINGQFSFENVKTGNYFLRASLLGYVVYRGDSFLYEAGQSKWLEEIKLAESSVTLKQVEVSAIKPLIEVKGDKTVFNVENSINSTGCTAYELLQKAPGVVVDNNENILLKGRGGVMVQIDGRETHLSQAELSDYLKSIQSTDVESIELITNPSSKYDAAGTAGIINIKLKKNKNYGTNGSVTLGYAYGKYSKYNSALSLNNRSKKLNFYGSYSNNWGDRYSTFFLYREQNPYIFDQSSLSKRSGLNNNYKAGMDYVMNNKNNFGMVVTGNYSYIKGTQINRNTISDFVTGVADSILQSDQAFKNRGNNINANLNHHFADTLGHDLTTDFDFGFFDGTRNTYIPNVYTLPDYRTTLSSSYFRSVTLTKIYIYTLKSDYLQDFLKGKLSAGFKISLVKTDNIFNFYNNADAIETIDNSRSNHFEYTENVNALYLNYQRAIKKFDFQAGVRTENTESEGDLKSATASDDQNVKRNYIDFFPSIGVTWNLHKNHSLGLIYSTRIDRPNYQDLNPFEYKLDELSFRKGNPFLNPQYSNKLELSHTYKYTTTTSIGYSRTKDFFAQITDTIAGGKSFLSMRNLAAEDVISTNVSTSLQPTKWYSIYLNWGFYNQKYDADFGNNKTIHTSFSSFNMYAQNTFKLPYNFTFEVSGWYNSGGVWGGSYKTNEQGSLDLGLQKKMLKDQATLKLSYTDILSSAPWDSKNTYAGIVIHASGNWESQQFRASFTWRFGNKQMKGIRQRASGNESEQKRIGGGD